VETEHRYFLCTNCTALFQVRYIDGVPVSEPLESGYRTTYCPYCGARERFIVQSLTKEIRRI